MIQCRFQYLVNHHRRTMFVDCNLDFMYRQTAALLEVNIFIIGPIVIAVVIAQCIDAEPWLSVG
jgi:hypothetical protein